MFQPFDNSPGLHQGVHLGLGVGLLESDPPPALSGRLVGDRGGGSSLSATSGTTPPALSGPGNCHLFGEIKPRAFQQGTVSRGANRHHRKEGLSNGLLRIVKFRDLANKFLRWLPPAKMWQQLLVYPGMVCFLGSSLNASLSVAAENPLVSSSRQSDRPVPISGMQRALSGGFKRRGRHQESHSWCPFLLSLYSDASLTSWDTHLLDLTTASIWSRDERDLHISGWKWRQFSWL